MHGVDADDFVAGGGGVVDGDVVDRCVVLVEVRAVVRVRSGRVIRVAAVLEGGNLYSLSLT